MKKNKTKKSVNGARNADVRRILDFYENQSDANAAKEIETAPIANESVWIEVPVQLVPQVKKLISKRRSA